MSERGRKRRPDPSLDPGTCQDAPENPTGERDVRSHEFATERICLLDESGIPRRPAAGPRERLPDRPAAHVGRIGSLPGAHRRGRENRGVAALPISGRPVVRNEVDRGRNGAREAFVVSDHSPAGLALGEMPLEVAGDRLVGFLT
jgi:hypothetical protein